LIKESIKLKVTHNWLQMLRVCYMLFKMDLFQLQSVQVTGNNTTQPKKLFSRIVRPGRITPCLQLDTTKKV
jgi:cell division septal protein FtsQ